MHRHPNARLMQKGDLRLVTQQLVHGRNLAELVAENGCCFSSRKLRLHRSRPLKPPLRLALAGSIALKQFSLSGGLTEHSLYSAADAQSAATARRRGIPAYRPPAAGPLLHRRQAFQPSGSGPPEPPGSLALVLLQTTR